MNCATTNAASCKSGLESPPTRMLVCAIPYLLLTILVLRVPPAPLLSTDGARVFLMFLLHVTNFLLSVSMCFVSLTHQRTLQSLGFQGLSVGSKVDSQAI